MQLKMKKDMIFYECEVYYMKSKLTKEEQEESRNNFNSFKKTIENIYTKVYLSYNNLNNINSRNLNIRIDFGETIYGGRINVYWDDYYGSKKEYKSKGLHGYYDANYCKMSFENNILVIQSTEEYKVIIELLN